MNRRHAYIRWSKAQSRLKKRLAAVATLALAVSAALMALAVVLREPEPDRPAPLVVASAAPVVLRMASGTEPAEAPAKARRIYPYSIIPGGVSDSGELARRLRTDKVAAAHYASFNVSGARAVTVTRPRGVYVSYRKGDKVYWTANKLMLAKGETLLSDGTSEVRTRCGNRISDLPQLPVEAKGPTAEELDSPVEQVQEGGEQPGLQLASFAMDENDMPSLAGLAYQLPVLASVANMVQTGYQPPSFGTFGKVASVGGVGDSPVTFFDMRPVTAATSETSGTDGSGSGSTGNPPANPSGPGTGGTDSPTDTGGSAPGGTPGTPTQPGSPTPTQPGSSTPTEPGSSTPDQPGSSTPTQPGSSTPDSGGTGGDSGSQPSPGNPVAPVGPKPDGGTEVPPEIPDDMLSPPTFPVKPAPPAQNHGVPEPGTAWLAGAALAALVLLRRLRPRPKR